jgi:1,4-dihydroxy-2-naphthoyl-CoA synthase
MMTFGTVLYEVKERIATITLNRPERFNAISETMPEDIAAAFQHEDEYVDACHMCSNLCLALVQEFPRLLAPGQVYGLE